MLSDKGLFKFKIKVFTGGLHIDLFLNHNVITLVNRADRWEGSAIQIVSNGKHKEIRI